MDKTILTIVLLCFVAFSASAQVENTKTTPGSKKNAVEQNKVVKKNKNAAKAAQNATQINNPNAPVIEFSKKVHNYGTIAKNSDGNCTFEFVNTGREPLVLYNVRSS